MAAHSLTYESKSNFFFHTIYYMFWRKNQSDIVMEKRKI